MGLIHILDNFTANSIAAGEVVERPSSVVKELIENSLDAGASVISIEVKQGGISLIRVSDNGCGFDHEDARVAFMRHSTSKISSIDDLQKLQTMGFRGEALASIAAVSEITLESRQPGSEEGIRLKLTAGDITLEAPSSCPAGTVIQIENLFYNQPARYKFLKKDQTEASYITDLVERMALGRPDISFRLINQDKEIIHTPGNDDLMSSIFAVYGKDTARSCIPISYDESPLVISGFLTDPGQSRHNRNRQNFYVNNRLIKSKLISAALDEAVKTWFMKGRYPTAILNIIMPVALVDVNVHPQKLEVRFWDEKKIFHCVYHSVRQALIDGSFIPNETFNSGTGIANDNINNSSMRNNISSDSPDITNDHTTDQQKTIKENAYQGQFKGYSLPISEKSKNDINIDETENVTQTGLNDENVQHVNDNDVNTSYHDYNEQEEQNDFELAENTVLRSRMSKLDGARIIGQAFNTYLILECEQDLFLVDQHAAHERILYEKLLINNEKSDAGSGFNRQPLLIPVRIHVTQSEKNRLEAEATEILRLGFEFDDFGPDSLLLRSVPAAAIDRMEPENAFRALIDYLDNENAKRPDFAARIFETIACKAAVKANDLLHKQEMEKLLDDLKTLENPYHCPHGRPVIVQLSKNDLEKMFKRIV